jgi:hypothetical protein
MVFAPIHHLLIWQYQLWSFLHIWGCKISKTFAYEGASHYHLEVQANPKKIATKKPMLFLASMGETGLSHDFFF